MPGPQSTRISGPGLFGRIMAWWVAVSEEHAGRILLGFFALTVVLLPVARHLRLDTDLRKLLPESYPVIRQMDVVLERLGDFRYFTVLVECADRNGAIAFAEAFAREAETLPFVRAVFWKRPVEFIREHVLLLTPLEDLQELTQYIRELRFRSSPFSLGLSSPSASGKNTKAEAARAHYLSLVDTPAYKFDDTGTLLGMQILPAAMDPAKENIRGMYAELAKLAESVRRRVPGTSPVQVTIAGSLRTKIEETSALRRDLARAGWIAGVLVLVVLYSSFRNVVSLGLLLIPLAMGMVWSFALAAVTVGFLSSISAVLYTALFGLGIDHGIHLLKGYDQWRATDTSRTKAMTSALACRGHAVWVSALTTTGGFGFMMLSDFKGFAHLGFIAATSMLLITLAYFLVLPSLVFAAHRLAILPEPKPDRVGLLLDSWLIRFVRWTPTRVGLALALGLVVVGAVTAVGIPFNYDFSALRGYSAEYTAAKERHHRVYPKALAPGAIFLADDANERDALIASLSDRIADDTNSPTMGRIVSRANLIPADQEARIAEIRRAAKLVTPLVLSRAEDPQLREMLLALKAAAELPLLTWEQMPAELRGWFETRDGSLCEPVFVFPSVKKSHGKEVIAFAHDVRPVHVRGRPLTATGDCLVFAEVIRSSVSQGLCIFALSIAGIGALVWVQFRSVRAMLHILCGLLMGLGLMAIVCRGMGMDLNFCNMIVLSAIVGVGIDSVIHLYAALRDECNLAPPVGLQERVREPVLRALARLAEPITACAFTTAAGYVAVMSADHAGLRSMGQLAVVGLTCCYLVSVTLYPIYLGHLTHKPFSRNR